PLVLGAILVHQGVVEDDVVERFEDRRLAAGDAVGTVPLEVADPHDHAGEFVGERVDLDAVELPRAEEAEAWRADLLGEGDDLVLKVLHGLQGDVEEVAAAAGGVEHLYLVEVVEELDDGRVDELL